AFLLRWSEAFKTDVSMWSQGMKSKRDSFIRFGVELDVLELDLELTVDELRTAYQVLYGAPEHLARKKFAVVYHTDNFYVRTHKQPPVQTPWAVPPGGSYYPVERTT